MFEGIEREIKRLNGKILVDLPLDNDGYLDRRCPEARCRLAFKVLFDDWSDVVADHAFCPQCGKKAMAECWNSPEQERFIHDAATNVAVKLVRRVIKRNVAQWNRQHSGGDLVSMKMDFKPGPNNPVSPPGLAEIIESKVQCPSCACRYAVVGLAFFCVACGHHDPDWVLDSSLDAFRKVMEGLPEILRSIPDRDAAAMAGRSWVENGLIKVVSSFESWAQHTHSRLAPSATAPRGSFQSLTRGSDLWKSLTGRSFCDHLDGDEWQVLLHAFQRRHLFVHRQGIVDADYLKKSGDETWAEGRRIVLTAQDILEYVRIVEKLAKGMRADAVEAMSSRN